MKGSWRIRLVLALIPLAGLGCGPQPAPDRAGGKDPVRTRTFVNSRAGLPAPLAEAYCDFSFDYPESWKIEAAATTKDPDPRNFVGASRVARDEDGTETTLEEIAVGRFTNTGAAGTGRELAALLAKKVRADFQRSAGPSYQESFDGFTRFQNHEVYEIRFSYVQAKKDRAAETYFLRCIILPGKDGSRNGLCLYCLASSRVPGMGRADDVGVKGELPVILNSFKLGK